MKRFIIFIIAALALSFAGQKKASAQFVIGAGYDRVQFTSDGQNDGNAFDGFSAEFGHTAMFIRNIVGLHFGVGYQFSTRRDDAFGLDSFAANVSTQEQMFQVPVRLVIDIPAGKKFGIVLYGGAYGAFSLSGIKTYEFSFGEEGNGNVNYDYLHNKISSDDIVPEIVVNAINASMDESRFKRYDYGVQAGLGFKLGSSVMIHGNYSYGLCDRVESGTRVNRNAVSVKISFLL